MDFSFQFAKRAANEPIVDPLGLIHITGEHRFVARGVDEAWDAATVLENPPERWRGEIWRAVRAGNLQAMLDVSPNVGAIQRLKMITHRDALAKLAQARVVQTVAQFWLPHQNDLKKFAVVGFEI